ncbi:MAG: hypothetical protein ACK2UY_00530 [Anaerolineae bacterium]|jgi:uncharacterized protein with PIN domain
MDEDRLCTACRASLAGPFEPRITLSHPAGEGEERELKVSARSWICPGCGLVHWYARDEDLDKLLEALPEDDEVGAIKPASSYERRSQMLRMLRRVRRI